MYESYFGLHQAPFSLTPSTHLFLNFGCYAEAIDSLNHGLQQNQGILKVTAEAGLGKTLICRLLLAQLKRSPDYVTAYVPNPYLSPEQLQVAVADELGLATEGLIGSHSLIKSLNEHLIRLALNNKRVVLIVDEAQAMPIDTLEALRLITNLETEQKKLVQIVLFAQPQLDQLLAHENFSQLQQRITVNASLRRLTEAETAYYIEQRLKHCGQKDKIFSHQALRAIHIAAQGLPRLVNVLAHESLLRAYHKQQHRIGWRHVRDICQNNPALKIPGFWNVMAGLRISKPKVAA